VEAITSFILLAYAHRRARNRSIIELLVCARRGLPLRGHQWNSTEHTKDDNNYFAYVIRWVAKTDAMLRSQNIESAASTAKQAYLSLTTQNELIAYYY